jgi:hypothetical protein
MIINLSLQSQSRNSASGYMPPRVAGGMKGLSPHPPRLCWSASQGEPHLHSSLLAIQGTLSHGGGGEAMLLCSRFCQFAEQKSHRCPTSGRNALSSVRTQSASEYQLRGPGRTPTKPLSQAPGRLAPWPGLRYTAHHRRDQNGLVSTNRVVYPRSAGCASGVRSLLVVR